MKGWYRFMQEARAGNFQATRSVRSFLHSAGAGNG